METALVRQPRGSPARPRAQRVLRVAVGVAGGALMAGAALLQPFAAPHLLPGRPNSSVPPVAVAPLLVTPPNAAPAAVDAGPPVPKAATNAAAATPRLVSPLAAALTAAPVPPPTTLGAPPAPREPLPLQTDLMTPSPAAANAPAPPREAAAGAPHG